MFVLDALMKRLLIIAALVVGLCIPVAGADDLRILTPAELVANSSLIVRAHVVKTKKSDWNAFQQVAMLEVVDVINGDDKITEVTVAAQWTDIYADDSYTKGDDVLVFLTLAPGIYRTVNYQFGKFRIVNETVIGWRNNDNVAVNAPYTEVRADVNRLAAELRTPSVEGGATAGKPGSVQNSTVPASAPVPPKNPKPSPGTPTKIIRPDRP